MKFRVTFKDPDTVADAIQEALDKEVDSLKEELDLRERSFILENRTAKLHGFVDKWIEYGEYITIEFDTEAKTATVVSVGE